MKNFNWNSLEVYPNFLGGIRLQVKGYVEHNSPGCFALAKTSDRILILDHCIQFPYIVWVWEIYKEHSLYEVCKVLS